MIRTEEGHQMIHICPRDWENSIKNYPAALCSRCMGRSPTLTLTDEQVEKLSALLDDSNFRQQKMMEQMKEEEKHESRTVDGTGN